MNAEIALRRTAGRAGARAAVVSAVAIAVLAASPVAAAARAGTRAATASPGGTLVVRLQFDGNGSWRHPSNGSNAEMGFHRVIEYSVPLKGVAGPASGFADVDRRERVGGFSMPNLTRYLQLRPRDLPGGPGRPCGHGKTELRDDARGLQVGDPGQPPLVPFIRTVTGGGAFPSGDPTVPERDLCLAAVALDRDKRVLHLRIDGSDSHVKVDDVINGRHAPPYHLRLQGDGSPNEAKKKLVLLDLPADASNKAFSGHLVIEDFNRIDAPGPVSVPLRATVDWRVTLDD